MQRRLSRVETLSYPYARLVADVWHLLAPYRMRFFVASTIRLSGDIIWLYATYKLSIVITLLGKQDPTLAHAVWVNAGLWAASIVWRITAMPIAKYIGYQVSERIALDAQLQTMRHVFLLDMLWHERENAGNKLKRMQKGGEGLDRIMRIWFNNVIEIAVNFIGVTIILARIDIRIAAIILVFLVTFFFLGTALTRRVVIAQNSVNIKEEEINGLLFETINNIRTVKALAIIRTLYGLLGKEIDVLFTQIQRRVLFYQGRSLLTNVWGQAFRFIAFFFIIGGIVRGHYELGLLVLFNGYFNAIWQSVEELTEVTQDFLIAKYGVARMMQILAEPICIDATQGKKAFPQSWRTIHIRNLRFSYDTQAVLKGISLDIRRGEKIGIVGLSGAGKSTLFKLLLKEQEGYDGEILLDDTPLRSIKKESYLAHVAAVLQETEVFNFSLKDNITIVSAKQGRNSTLFKRALATAHVNDFINKLPHNVNTYIGEKGFKLSGGERQRVGIARAVFKQPQILLLDEATSHLDLESEKKIQDSLHRFFRSVTAIVIAHRLTTIKEMDRIVVIEGGRILEVGSFAELYAKRGRFYDLWEQQRL